MDTFSVLPEGFCQTCLLLGNLAIHRADSLAEHYQIGVVRIQRLGQGGQLGLQLGSLAFSPEIMLLMLSAVACGESKPFVLVFHQ
jgi:hypothetical protein